MCKILSRLKVLADAEGVSIGFIERAIGASRGVISKAITKGTDIQSKWLELICEKFPQYSPTWLLTGEGDMLRSSTLPSKIQSLQSLETPSDKIFAGNNQKLSQQSDADIVNTLLANIKDQAEEIGRLKAKIERLEEELQEVREFPPTPIDPNITESLSQAQLQST